MYSFEGLFELKFAVDTVPSSPFCLKAESSAPEDASIVQAANKLTTRMTATMMCALWRVVEPW
jgi:hypothetical protein